MSSDSTRSRGVQSAGAISGSSKTTPSPGTARPAPLDRQGAADAAVDEVAHREADVGLVGGDARARSGGRAAGERRRESATSTASRRPAGERHPVGGLLHDRAQTPRRFGVPRLDVEARHEAAVADEERAAVLEHAVEVDDRPAGLDAIGRLEDEAALAGR